MKSLEFAPETAPQSPFLPTLLGTRRGPESDISDVADKVFAGERITDEDALRLFHHPNLGDLALLADFVRQKKNPGRTVTYVVGRNVNYTNVCWVRCKFCNFYRVPGAEGGYVHPKEVIFQKIQETVDVGGCEILMQGGLNPKLKIEWYEDLLSSIRERFPDVILHAFSPAELIYGFLFEISATQFAANGAVATEEGLMRFAQAWAAREDAGEDADTPEKAAACFRWGSTEDAWYQRPFEPFDAVNELLDRAEEQGLYERYGDALEKLCIEVLREMDADGRFGMGKDRAKVAVGVCYTGGDNGAKEFLGWARRVNPPAVYRRMRREYLGEG